MKQITQEQREAFAKDLQDLQKKHGISLFSSLQIAPLQEEAEEKEDNE